MRTVWRSVFGSSGAALLMGAGLLNGQVRQQGTASGTLVLSDPRAAAIDEYTIALDDYQNLAWTEGFAHAERAIRLDSSFGLARALYARYRGGPNVSAEVARGAGDAVHNSTPEAILALADASTGPAAAGLWDLAVKLHPNDSRVAMARALAMNGRARIDALHDVANRFPGAAAPRVWLAYALVLPLTPPRPKAIDDEALALAQEAVRLAPNSSAAHAVLGFVYERMDKDDDAMTHFDHASGMPFPFEGTFQLRAELLERQGHYAAARAALDSAILLTDNIDNRASYMNYRAVSFLYERNLGATMSALDDAARDARANGNPAGEAALHTTMSIVYAGVGNVEAAEQHRAIARRLGATPGQLADAGVIIYGLTKQGAAARNALESYVQAVAGQAPDLRAENVHRMTGLTLLAEGKADEAIGELKQGGRNPFAQLGLIDAYTQLGRKKDADAERDAMLSRKDFGIGSTAVPIARYRYAKK